MANLSAEQRQAVVDKYENDLNSEIFCYMNLFEKDECPTLDIRRYECRSCIGRGGWGVVYTAVTRDNISVAIKSFEKAEFASASAVAKVVREKKIQFAMENEFVTKLLGKYKDAKYLCLVFEYAIYSDLRNFVKVNGDAFLEESICKKVMVQVAMGIEYVHSCDIIIRDLKPDNILVYNGGRVKVADFGLACTILNHPYKAWATKGYIAPEMLLEQEYGEEVDWWAYAITLYQILAGMESHPYLHLGTREDSEHDKITKFPHHYDAAKWGSLSPEVNDLVKAFLELDMSKRPGCKSFKGSHWKDHAWFKDIDWYHVLRGKEQFPIDEAIVNKYDFFEACEPFPFDRNEPDNGDTDFEDF